MIKSKFDVPIGSKFTLWEVIGEGGKDKYGNYLWKCRCICGNERNLKPNALITEHTKSCGCVRKYDEPRHQDMPEYVSWRAMKLRCYNKNHNGFKDYGAKGIGVCDRWLNSFDNFFEDMGKRPTRKHTLERKDNELGYSKSNCEWATHDIQSRNKSSNVWYTFNGKTMIFGDWASLVGVSSTTMKHHLDKGYSFDEVYSYFVNKRKGDFSSGLALKIRRNYRNCPIKKEDQKQDSIDNAKKKK